MSSRELRIRPGTSDLGTIANAILTDQHRPPPEIAALGLRRICELGANVGASMAAMADRHPDAELLGVEPDPDNAAMARINLSQFGRRCHIVEAAVWDDEVVLVIEGDATDGFTVRPARQSDPPQLPRVHGETVDELLRRHMPSGEIDYLHMCIEGTEPRVLAAGGAWPQRVRSLRIELYPHWGFGGPECVASLNRLGYEAWFEPADEHSLGYGFGIRR